MGIVGYGRIGRRVGELAHALPNHAAHRLSHTGSLGCDWTHRLEAWMSYRKLLDPRTTP